MPAQPPGRGAGAVPRDEPAESQGCLEGIAEPLGRSMSSANPGDRSSCGGPEGDRTKCRFNDVDTEFAFDEGAARSPAYWMSSAVSITA
jgi:hypothetical protein